MKPIITEHAEELIREQLQIITAAKYPEDAAKWLQGLYDTAPKCAACIVNARPSCRCITPLCRATHKEIREAHNLEKMYVNGVFGS